MIGVKLPKRFTIERWTRDCLDVGFLRRKGLLDGGWVTIVAVKWPRVGRLRIARYLIVLDIVGRSDPQDVQGLQAPPSSQWRGAAFDRLSRASMAHAQTHLR